MQERVQTRVKLMESGVCNTNSCLISDNEHKIIKYLLFNCPFSKRCLNEILLWIGIALQMRNVKRILRRIVRNVELANSYFGQ